MSVAVGFEKQRLYFGPEGTLAKEQPTGSSAADEYEVDFAATIGDATRWGTFSKLPVQNMALARARMGQLGYLRTEHTDG